jgi:hypothetical protein
MSSSRDFPFSFSPDVRLSLGDPGPLNASLRSAFPDLFNGHIASLTYAFQSEFIGPGVGVHPGVVIPTGTVVGLFFGHAFLGAPARGTYVLPLPTSPTLALGLPLAIDGAARAARFPDPTNAALFQHSCLDPTVRGEWWLSGVMPCLLARTTQPLSHADHLTWCFDDHTDPPLTGYTMSHTQARAWRSLGGLTHRCTCNTPRDCERDRFLRSGDT